MRVREQLHVLFGVRPEETPAALAEALQKQTKDRLAIFACSGRMELRLTGFPMPCAHMHSCQKVLISSLRKRRPNTCIRQFLACLDDVREQTRLVDKLFEFFSSQRRDEYERTQAVLSALRVATVEGLATEAMRTALRRVRRPQP